jgi:DnaJ-class molecular chaperone
MKNPSLAELQYDRCPDCKGNGGETVDSRYRCKLNNWRVCKTCHGSGKRPQTTHFNNMSFDTRLAQARMEFLTEPSMGAV